jgi:hypothetical protein
MGKAQSDIAAIGVPLPQKLGEFIANVAKGYAEKRVLIWYI